jgi:hypothetical protein
MKIYLCQKENRFTALEIEPCVSLLPFLTFNSGVTSRNVMRP